jgi:hypothetical protein
MSLSVPFNLFPSAHIVVYPLHCVQEILFRCLNVICVGLSTTLFMFICCLLFSDIQFPFLDMVDDMARDTP